MFAVVAIVALGSCTNRLTDFTVISTKNFPIGGNYQPVIEKAQQRVKGKDTKHMVLFIPLGFPNLKAAIDKAIESYPGAIGLADGVVKSSGWSAILYGQSSYIVEGTPIYDKNDPHVRSNSSNYVDYNQPVQQNTGGETLVFFHDVKNGESLSDIAKSYGCSVSDIIKWNNLSSATIVPGTKLKVYIK